MKFQKYKLCEFWIKCINRSPGQWLLTIIKSKPVTMALICFYLISCSASSPKPSSEDSDNNKNEPPPWYLARDFQSAAFEITGYGSGKTYDEALVNAKKEIAEQIKTRIISESRLDGEKNGQQVQGSFNTRTQSLVDIILHHVKIIRQEIKNKTVFVLVSYLNIPYDQRLVNELKNSENLCQASKPGHPYLTHTLMSRKLIDALGCSLPFTPVRKNHIWYIQMGDAFQYLTEDEFLDLFAEIKGHDMELTLSDSHLNAGQVYHIKAEIKSSGYFSLISVFQNGQAVGLLMNQYAQKRETFIYPDLEQYEGLNAELIGGNKNSDLILGILCPSPIDLSRLEKITVDKMADSEQNYLFGYLINNTANCQFSSHILTIAKTSS